MNPFPKKLPSQLRFREKRAGSVSLRLANQVIVRLA